MITKKQRFLAVLLTLVLLLLASLPALAEADDGIIFDFDSEKPTSSSNTSGIDISFDTNPANTNSEMSMRIDPLVGYSMDLTQLNYTFSAGTFKSDGIVFWGKSERYEAILDIIFAISWRDGNNEKHSSTYVTQQILTNNGREIVVPFDECVRRFGEECDFAEKIKTSYCNMVVRYYEIPEDTILSPIWLDTMRDMTSADVATDPIYGEPNPEVEVDPDTLYTPSAESTGSDIIFDMSAIPSSFSGTGFIMAHNSNPAKADAGHSLKLTPTYADVIKFSTGLAKGKLTGSGIRLWLKSESKTVIINMQLQLSDPDDASLKGWYGTELTVTPQGKYYDVYFKDLHYVSGKYVNQSKSARANFSWFIFQFYNKTVDTFYFDTLTNLPYDESMEAEDPVVITTVPTVDDTTHDMSLVYDWDLDSDWKLDWSDEFSDGVIDTNVWSNNYGIRNSAEAGYFTDRKENIREENGQLVIETLKEDYKGLAEYTSAELVTKNKKYFMYGRLEIKAKLPGGMGMWPAFWTLGNGVWPTAGEIDILEMIGGPSDSTRGTSLAHFTLHYADNNSQGHLAYGESYTLKDGKDFTTDYHTIGMIWTPNEIKFYVDEDIYCSIDITDAQRYKEFHQPHYALLNTSVGSNPGGWARTPDETTFQQRQLYQIDYIRYYTYNGPDATPSNPSASSSATTTTTTTKKATTTTTTASMTVPQSGRLVFADFEDATVGSTAYTNEYISKTATFYNKPNVLSVVDASEAGIGSGKVLKLAGGADYGLNLSLKQIPPHVKGFRMKVYEEGSGSYTPKVRYNGSVDVTSTSGKVQAGVWNTCEFELDPLTSDSFKINTGLLSSGVATYYDDFEWIFDTTATTRPSSAEPKEPYTSPYEITDGYLSGATVGQSVENFASSFTVANSDIKVTVQNADGTVADSTAPIATGMKVLVASEDTTYLNCTVVLSGDISGDGRINAADMLLMKQHVLHIELLSGAYKQAALIKGYGTANSMDMLLLKRHILGLYTITQ